MLSHTISQNLSHVTLRYLTLSPNRNQTLVGRGKKLIE